METNWMEALIQLRDKHLNQWRTFYIKETTYQRVLTRRYQTAKWLLSDHLEIATLTRQHIDSMLILDNDRQERSIVLKQEQLQAIYNLLLAKLASQD